MCAPPALQVSGNMAAFKPADLSRILWGFAAAGVEDTEFIKAVAKVGVACVHRVRVGLGLRYAQVRAVQCAFINYMRRGRQGGVQPGSIARFCRLLLAKIDFTSLLDCVCICVQSCMPNSVCLSLR